MPGLRLLVTVAGLLTALPALAQIPYVETIEGPGRAIDADIIMVGEQRVILWGIDAPERTQFCLANAQRWGCYEAALRTLQTLASRGTVSCVLVGEPDPFNRRYGVCESGGEDINAAMVRAGMALAYLEQSADYLPVQDEAIVAQAGLWQLGVEFLEPWVWRQRESPGGYR
jgi:endonuclease YncB( thermonuclease family)